MTWIVNWNGTDHDVDPMTFDGLELSQIKQKTGLGFHDLLRAIPQMDGDAIRVLFWTVERRNNADLGFTDYRGPSLNVIMPTLRDFAAGVADLGKALKTPTTETTGSPSSPSSSEPSTEPSTTD